MIIYKKFVNTISEKLLVLVLPNMQLRCFGLKDELIGFCDQKVKGQGHNETAYSQIRGQFFTCLFNAGIHLN